MAIGLSDFLARATGQADRIDSVTAKLEAAIASLAEKDDKIAQLEKLLAEAPQQGAISTRDEEIADLKAKLADAEASAEKAKADLAKLPEQVNAEAARIVASQGHEQVQTEGSKEVCKQMSFSDFKKLPHAEREQFLKSGGKLIS